MVRGEEREGGVKKVVYGPRRKFRVTRKIRQEERGRGDVLPLETAVERGLSLESERESSREEELSLIHI